MSRNRPHLHFPLTHVVSSKFPENMYSSRTGGFKVDKKNQTVLVVCCASQTGFHPFNFKQVTRKLFIYL